MRPIDCRSCFPALGGSTAAPTSIPSIWCRSPQEASFGASHTRRITTASSLPRRSPPSSAFSASLGCTSISSMRASLDGAACELGSSAAELGDGVRPPAHGLLHRGRSLISESFHASHIIASFAQRKQFKHCLFDPGYYLFLLCNLNGE